MKILENESLKPFNTFKVDVSAKRILFLENEEDFFSEKLKNTIKEGHFVILGECSNTLFTNNYNGTIIIIRNKGVEIIEDSQEYKLIRVSAGENWNEFVAWTTKNNLIGL